MSVVVSLVAGFFLLFAVTWAIQDYTGELGRDVPAGTDLHRRGRTPHGRVPVVHLRPRAVLLRHGVGHRELAHGVCVQPRRRAAGLTLVEPGQPPYRYAHEFDLAVCGLLDDPRPAGATQHHRVHGDDGDRGHRALRRVRHPGLPSAAGQGLPGRPMEPGPLEQADRLDRSRLGRDHLHPVHLAESYPITGSNFNYTIVAVAVVLGGAWLWWALSAAAGSPVRGRTSTVMRSSLRPACRCHASPPSVPVRSTGRGRATRCVGRDDPRCNTKRTTSRAGTTVEAARHRGEATAEECGGPWVSRRGERRARRRRAAT